LLVLAHAVGVGLGWTAMFDPQTRFLRWLGFWMAFAGAVVSNTVPPDEMLPINRGLFAIVSVLMLMWLLVLVTHDREGPR